MHVIPRTLCLTLVGAWLTSGLAFAREELEGEWICSCWQDADDQSVTETTHYESGKFKMVRTFSIRQGCDDPSYEFVVNADYVIGSASTAVPGAIEIDYTWRSATLRPLTVASALTFNVLRVCGLGDWRADEPRDVTGRACDGRNPTGRSPVSYQIVALDGDSYSVGDTSSGAQDGTTADRRPTRLDSDIICKRR